MNKEVSETTGTIVIDADQEKIEKLKKRWTTVNNVSTAITNVAGTGFVASMLSPFDFDGPVVEIVTAVTALVGFLGKMISKYRLEQLKDKEDLRNLATQNIDEEDKKTLLTIAENVKGAMDKQNAAKTM